MEKPTSPSHGDHASEKEEAPGAIIDGGISLDRDSPPPPPRELPLHADKGEVSERACSLGLAPS
jgi:hypothetical protein